MMWPSITPAFRAARGTAYGAIDIQPRRGCYIRRNEEPGSADGFRDSTIEKKVCLLTKRPLITEGEQNCGAKETV